MKISSSYTVSSVGNVKKVAGKEFDLFGMIEIQVYMIVIITKFIWLKGNYEENRSVNFVSLLTGTVYNPGICSKKGN